MKKLFMLLFVVLAFFAKYDVSINVNVSVSKEREQSRAEMFKAVKNTLKNHNPITWAFDYIDYDRCNNGKEHDEGVCEALRKKY